MKTAMVRWSAIFAVVAAIHILSPTTTKADVRWYFNVTGYAGPVKSGPFSSRSECEQNAQAERSLGYSASCYSEGSDSSSAGADLATPGLNPALQKAAFDFGYALGNWLVRGHKNNNTSNNNKTSSKSDDNPAVQQQQQAYLAELERQRQEAKRQQILAEQRQLQATFDRLGRQLRFDQSPNLTLKGADSNQALQLKFDDTAPSDSKSGTLRLKLGDDRSSKEKAASPMNGAGCAPAGIAGLPGVYLNGCQVTQTSAFLSSGNPVQLAQAAQEMSGPEQALVEDSALRAAAANPQFISQSRDAKVTNFQELDADFQNAQQAQNHAAQELLQAQDQNEAAKAAMHVAQIEIAKQQAEGSTPPPAVQQALDNMKAVANTDEEAVMRAQWEFDNAQVSLAMTRSKATDALIAMAPPSDSSVVDLHDKQQPLVISPSTANGSTSIVRSRTNAASPSPVVARRTAGELCTEVAGLQQALRRLAQAQASQNTGREQWLAVMDDATRDAAKQAAEFVTEGSTTVLTHYLDKKMQDTVIRRAADGIDKAKRQELDKEFKALWDAKKMIEESQAKRKQLPSAYPFDERKWKSIKAKDLEDWLDDAKDVIDMTLAKPEVRSALKLTEEGNRVISLSESVMESGYNIARDVVSIRQIDILNQNADQYLAAVNRLKRKMEDTVTNSSFTGNCAASR